MKPNLRSIAVRLPAMIAALAIAVAALISVFSYVNTRAALMQEAGNRLEMALSNRRSALESWLKLISNDLVLVKEIPTTTAALKTLGAGWSVIEGDRTATLRSLYVDRNPNPPEGRDRLADAGDNSLYTQAHVRFHSFFSARKSLRGYSDVILVDAAGEVLYSVAKHQDFATSVMTGPFRDSALGSAFRRAMADPDAKPVFVDFDSYAAADGQTVAFMAQRLNAADGQPLGVVVFQFTTAGMDALLNDTTGLGKTGHVTVIGPDRKVRNVSRFADEQDGHGLGLPAAGMNRALSGESGLETEASGKDGVAVFVAFAPVDSLGAGWAIIVEQDQSELVAAADRLRTRGLLLMAVASLAAVVLGLLLARGISRPLAAVGRAMDRVADGDYVTDVPGTARKDEVGQIARDLDGFRVRLAGAAEAARMTTFQSAAFRASASAMMLVDRDLNIIDLNPAQKRLFASIQDRLRKHWPDFDPEKLIGQNIDRFHKNPEHQRRLLSDPSKMPFTAEITLGDVRLQMDIAAIHDDDGTFAGCSSQWKDIGAERVNEAITTAIRKNQVMIEYDPNLNIIAVNDIFTRIYGHGPEVIGRNFESIFGQNEDTETQKARLRKGQTVAHKVERRTKDGRSVWVDVAMNAMLKANGELDRIVEVAADVTAAEAQRVEAEAEKEHQASEQRKVVEQLRRGLSALAEGNLTETLDQPFAPEYEQLRQDFSAAQAKLTDVLGRLIATTGNINSGAAEMSQAADDLSRRTENQAATLEETAAALDELTASVRSAAEGAGEADQAVRSARENAEASGQVVLQAVDAMSEIEKSSDQIGQIIGVIDDIAFQTNLLALNAGVEAARAGEAGRGFAVVASEVRSLAQRSSEAAKEIKALISASGSHVERGVTLVGQAGDALGQIVESVAHISGLVAAIAASSTEQATGLSEINTGVNQLDEVTQQNAAMVEETTAASHSLRQESEALSELVSLFRVRPDAGAEIVGLSSARAKTPVFAARRAAVTITPADQPARTGTDASGWEDF